MALQFDPRIFSNIFVNSRNDVLSSSSETLPEQWDTFNFEASARKYVNKIHDLYGTIQIWLLSEPIPLEEIYTHVKVLQELNAQKKQPIKQIEDMFCGRHTFGQPLGQGISGIDLVRKTKRVYILGKPGSGKTTFLKHVIHESIREQWGQIPIFVPLRRFSESGQPLLDFIVRQFEICNFPEALPFVKTMLLRGNAIVLFDGLDEVQDKPKFRQRLINKLKNFMEDYHASKFVITCRIKASEAFFEGFTYAEIADFSDRQIRTFVDNWFKRQKQTADMFLKEYHSEENVRFKDLARIPLLLTLLCIDYEDSYSFPTNRSEAFENAIYVLLRRWSADRMIEYDSYKKLSHNRRLQMFTEIAAQTFRKEQFVFHHDELVGMILAYINKLPDHERDSLKSKAGEINGDAILDSIIAQHGFFVERAKDFFTFAHLAIQEHLTAKSIVEGDKSDLTFLVNKIFDVRWREVCLLYAERMNDPSLFFSKFLEKIHNKIKKNDRIRCFFQSVYERNFKKSNSYRISAVISFYFNLELQILIFQERSLLDQLLDTRRDPPLTTNPAIRQENNQNIVRIYNGLSDLFYIRDTALAIAKKLDAALEKDLNYDVHLSKALMVDKTMVSHISDIYKQNLDFITGRKEMLYSVDGGERIYKVLQNISAQKAPDENLKIINNIHKFLKCLKDSFGLGSIESISDEEQALLKDIFYAFNLFLDCLNRAISAERDHLENHLFKID